MSDHKKQHANGFSLLEMTIAMALGTVVLGAAVQLYSQGVAATWTVTQRAEMQEDYRAASNMLLSDLSLAGTGLNPGAAIQLPTSATLPVFGCAQAASACYLGLTNAAGASYPVQGTTPYLYGLLPGYKGGPLLPSGPEATDTVTVVYTDSTFFLDCYDASVASTTTVTFVLGTESHCTANGATIQAITDPAAGLSAGDLVLFTFGTIQIVAEVTTTPTSSTVTFATSDKLQMNQGAAVPKSLASEYVAGPPLTTGFANRLFVVTYYVDKTTSPYRLMRQVSGHSPIPVAENISYFKLTYDLFNASSDTPAVGCKNPGAVTDVCTAGSSSGLLPNQITKINIVNMAMDSALKGSQFGIGNGYQRMNLQTSVTARNLTYTNNYNVTSP